ncbi:MAG TPA: DUF3293 domain-containing protein [Xanthomonadaceae bacterium]|nr:DUF3293 domain-containing protein [Xanthomonadaceae bacterium]
MIPHLFEDAHITALAHAYLAADYRWEFDGQWRELVIGEAAPDPEARFVDAMEFGLVTAWNPHSVIRPERANRVADDALQAELAAGGTDFRPGFAAAHNRSWREPGWLVAGMPMAALDALAQRYGQLGTLYWRRGAPVRLRLFHAQPVGWPGSPWVDWIE